MTGERQAPGFGRLTRRSHYLATARGARHHTAWLSIQMIERPLADPEPPRFGLTVSRKVGTAVERNRVKRRLRGVLLAGAKAAGRTNHDYVIVARRDLLHAPFQSIVTEVARGIERLHRSRRKGPVGSRQSPSRVEPQAG
jgi:ribonuclease P protein component